MLTAEALERQIHRELPHLRAEYARELSRIIGRLAESFQLERIYVFGSQARGEATPESDVDLLVVVPHSALPPHRRDQLAYQAIGEHLFPLDILVMTHDEFERRRLVVASLPATVAREGRILYAA